MLCITEYMFFTKKSATRWRSESRAGVGSWHHYNRCCNSKIGSARRAESCAPGLAKIVTVIKKKSVPRCARPAAAAPRRLRRGSRGLARSKGSGRAHLRPRIFISGVFLGPEISGNRKSSPKYTGIPIVETRIICFFRI